MRRLAAKTPCASFGPALVLPAWIALLSYQNPRRVADAVSELSLIWAVEGIINVQVLH
jgi:hypothetical protein